MKTFGEICICLGLLLFLIACPSSPTVSTQVDKVPILWNSSVVPKSMGISKSIMITTGSPEWDCTSLAPMLTGWQAGTYYVGNSYTCTVLGNTITTTISQDGTDIVYTGVFDDDPDGGGYVLTYHPDGSFDFHQSVIWYHTDYGFKFYVISDLSGTTSGTSYSGTGIAHCYQYEIGGTNHSLIGLNYTAHASIGYFGVLIDSGICKADGTLPEPVYNDTSFVSAIDALTWTVYPDGNMTLAWYESGAWNASTTSGPTDPNWN